MFCQKCGTEIPDNSTFCTNCGTPLHPSSDQSETIHSVHFTREELARIITMISCIVMGIGLCLPFISALGVKKTLIEGDGIFDAPLLLLVLLFALKKKPFTDLFFSIPVTGFTIFEYLNVKNRQDEFSLGTLISFDTGFYLLLIGNVALVCSVLYSFLIKYLPASRKNLTELIPAIKESFTQEEDGFSTPPKKELSPEEKELRNKRIRRIVMIASACIIILALLIGIGSFLFKYVFLNNEERSEINEVISMIDSIGTVSIESGDLIYDAVAAYDELSPKCQKRITNLNILEDAEISYDSLCVENAETLIDRISYKHKISWEDGSKVDNARSYYDSLTADQKNRVSNIALLEEYEDSLRSFNEAAEISLAFMDGLSAPDYSVVEQYFYNTDLLFNNSFFMRVYLPSLKKSFASGLALDIWAAAKDYTRYDGAKQYSDLDQYQQSSIDSLSEHFLKRYLNSYSVKNVVQTDNGITVTLRVQTIAQAFDQLDLQDIISLALKNYIDQNESTINIVKLGGVESTLSYIDSMYYLSIYSDAVELTDRLIDELLMNEMDVTLIFEYINGKLMVTDIQF